MDLALVTAAETVREMFADGSVRTLRKARGWPIRVPAGQAGVSDATWCRWETGVHLPASGRAAGPASGDQRDGRKRAVVDKAEKRRLKAVMADPGFQEFARVVEERQRLRGEVAKARAADPERAWVYDLAKSTGNKGAQEFLDRTAPGSEAEFDAYLGLMAKSADSAIARRAQELQDERGQQAFDRVRKQGGAR